MVPKTWPWYATSPSIWSAKSLTSDRSSAAESAPPGTRNTCWKSSARCGRNLVNLDSLPWCLPAILKVAVEADFGDSQIIRKMIHHMDEALAAPSGGFESRLRRLSGPPEGPGRQYRHGGFRPVGLRDVFHAERLFPVLSTRSGGRAGAFKLPKPVRHRENSVRQLHPRHARRSGPRAARALLRASGISAGRAAFAPGLWPAGWQNARRLGWNRVLLLVA